MRKIEVKLIGDDKTDTLVFDFEEPLTVNLNSSKSQEELKNVFSCLLSELMKQKVELVLSVSDGYSRPLYVDVFTEYINALNKEIGHVLKRLPIKQ